MRFICFETIYTFLYAHSHVGLYGVYNASVLRTGEISWRAYIAAFVASACRAAPLISLIKLAADRPVCSPPFFPRTLPISYERYLYSLLRINFWFSYFSPDFLEIAVVIFALRFASVVERKCAVLSYLNKYITYAFFFRFQFLWFY